MTRLGIALLTIVTVGYSASVFARSHVLVISGIGGESHYSDLFYRWSKNLTETIQTSAGVPAEHIYYLAEDPNRDPELIVGRSTQDEIVATIESIAASAAIDDNILVVLIGHGTDNGRRVAFNIPGPDLDVQTLDNALTAFGDRLVAIVNTTASSASFANLLSRDRRIVITATTSPAENQHTRFASVFATAFSEPGADRDKDKRVSLLEAFDFSVRETRKLYEMEDVMVTEHAQIDDNGDGTPSREPSELGDGALARTFFLEAEQEATAADRERLALNVAARRIVDEIENLKRSKRLMDTDMFSNQLEELLVQLALNRREHRNVGNGN